MFKNEFIITGNLSKDFELKTTPNDKKVINFSVCQNTSYTPDGEKEPVKNSTWFDFQAWGKLAEGLSKSEITKGDHLYIEGKLKSKKVKDANGYEMNCIFMVANIVQLLRKPGQKDS